MARILVHALAATAGGGANYLRNFLRQIGAVGARHQWLVLVPREFVPVESLPGNVEIVCGGKSRSAPWRVYQDQVWARKLAHTEQIAAILATGNFGMLRPPVPQVLLHRNALYYCGQHYRELRRRGEVHALLTNYMKQRLALNSLRASAANVAPTRAMVELICRCAPEVDPGSFRVVPHGFDHEWFRAGQSIAAPAWAAQLDPRPNVARILLVGHYNYHRNFETVLRAIGRLRRTLARPVELVLTTRLGIGVKDRRYDTTAAACLMVSGNLHRCVAMLGSVPPGEMAALYRAADVVVCPSYAESFGHPMVEAMAAGKPIVASDLPPHREVCGDAAVYFPVFDPQVLAEQLHRLLDDPSLAGQLAENGRRRSQQFCWRKHFGELVGLIDEAIGAIPAPQSAEAA